MLPPTLPPVFACNVIGINLRLAAALPADNAWRVALEIVNVERVSPTTSVNAADPVGNGCAASRHSFFIMQQG